MLTSFSVTEVVYGAQHTVTCTVEGGKAPHKVTLESPSDQVYTWEENGGTVEGRTSAYDLSHEEFFLPPR